jgi:hypothetical protein
MGSLRLEQGLFSRGMPISRETILRVGSRRPVVNYRPGSIPASTARPAGYQVQIPSHGVV